jgi:SAM-dependent methyltransferase
MTEGDAFGQALVDHLEGGDAAQPELETDSGYVGPALPPAWFFRGFDEWDWWEHELLGEVVGGPVLDLGAGAGRVSLWLQERGLEVTSIEASPLAAEVCRARGLRDVRVGDLNDPPGDRKWTSVLLLCGNLGLGGSYDGIRRLLHRLADVCSPNAVLVGDTVDPGGGPPDVRLRIRYAGQATAWWPQYNIPVAEIPALVDGSGWVLDRHIIELPDHAVLLRRSQ